MALVLGQAAGIIMKTIKDRRLKGPLILLMFLGLVLAGCRQGVAKSRKPQKQSAYQGVIVAAGDSLTAGLGVPEDEAYPARLQRRLAARGLHWRVINSGVSGETSSGLLSRLNWVLSLHPDIIIVETGANDGLRGIDPTLTRANIMKIIGILKKKKIVTILAGMQMVSNLGNAYTTAFRRLYPEVAEKTGVILMPFFLKDVATVPELNQSDGIHPTPKGYKIIVDNLLPYVTRAIELEQKQARP